MYKNLSAFGLGVSGRQSELIELALTNEYKGIDIDIERFMRQVKRGGLESARRYLDSAVKYCEDFAIGGWKLPVRLGADEGSYRTDLSQLAEVAETAGAINALRCHAVIEPAHDSLAYHENFEQQRQRISAVAEELGKHGIRLGLNFQPSAIHRKNKAHEFVHKAEELLALMQSVSGDNVGLAYDSWNWYVGGGDLTQLKEVGVDKIVSVRVADVPADADLANIGPQSRTLPSEDGLIDHDALIQWLHENGYDGPVTPDPHVGTFSGMTRDQIVSLGSKSLEPMWIAIGLSQPRPEPVAVESQSDDDEDDDDDDDDDDTSADAGIEESAETAS